MLPVPTKNNNTNNKRKIIDFLPHLLQTTILKSFFNATVEQVYSKPDNLKLDGYIGKITDYYNKNIDFYIQELDKKRQIRQIQHSVIYEENDKKNAIFYDDIVNYIKINEGIVKNAERLFEEDFYSWHPPIDIDAFLNYTNYYWCVTAPEAIVINDPTDFDSLIGSTSATIVVDGSPLTLSNGMILLPKNDVNPEYNDKRWIVEGIGRAFILVEDTVGAGGWDVTPWDSDPWDFSFEGYPDTPDYITMERGCRDKNPWSLTNRWFHKDVIKNFNDPALIKIRARRPIIIFERDLELWNFGKNYRGKVQLIVNCKEFYNIISGLTPGYDGHPFDSEDLDCNISDIGYDPVWEDASSGVSGVTVDDGYGEKIPIYDGMRILIIDSSNPSATGKIYTVTGIKDLQTIVLQLDNVTSVDSSGEPHYGDHVRYVDINGVSHYFWYNGTEWVEAQTKTSVNQEPLFQLYDIYKNKLDDETIYNNSTFKGSEIFSYALDRTSPIDTEIGKPIKYNELGEIVFENDLVTNVYQYTDLVTNEIKNILPYYFWKIDSPYEHLKEYGNNWHLVPYKSRQYLVFRETLDKAITNYELKYTPLSPIIDKSRFFTESLIIKINGKKLEYNTDFTLSGKTVNFVTLPERGDILEIYLITDDETDETDIYDLPLNLTHNALNKEIDYIGYNNLFNHFATIIKNQQGFVGSELGPNNYRDTPKEKWKGNIILQHTAPLSFLGHFVKNNDNDFINALLYCRNEYIRFYNKFLNKLNQFFKNNTINSSNPADWVDEIIRQLKIGKNERFPFHNTGVINVSDQNSYFVPPTPAFLGITPLYKPQLGSDDRLSSTSFIIGHDGTYIPLYGDFRDQVILEFENRIYESAPDKFKNDYLPLFSWYDIVPGRWRTTSYKLEEINDILEKRFNLWVNENDLEIEEIPSENGFFGINYSTTTDVYGNRLPGHWRGIYRYYFDTDRPDLYPWEMLGFSKKPDWWDTEYGTYPYTRGNVKLWEDLRDGRIRQGPREGIDPRFSRPDLLNHIPVDDYGNLLDPVAIGIVNNIPPSNIASKKYKFGDGAKIETIWRKSNSFSFDLTLLMFLTYPAKFAYFHHDNKNITWIYDDENNRTSKQLILENYHKRPLLEHLIFHDEKENIVNAIDIDEEIKKTFEIYNSFSRIYGFEQFISSYIEKNGKDISKSLGELIRSTDINLTYQCGGFIEDADLTTDIFGDIPKENIHVVFYNSNPFNTITYSAVIIEKTPKGWKIKGYDIKNKEFKYYKPIKNNNYKVIGVGIDETNTKIWAPNTLYKTGDVVYNVDLQAFFKARKDFVSGETFNQSNWTRIKNMEPKYDLSVKVYKNFEKTVSILPYGTEFQNLQSLADFMIGYQKYLEEQGIIFNDYDYDTDSNINFEWSIKEFLAWVLSQPENNEFIALSPIAKRIKLKLDFGYIDNIFNYENGILNRFGEIIDAQNIFVQRNGDEIIIEPSFIDPDEENLIYFLKLYTKSSEHAIVIDNETIFGNIINTLTGYIERFRLSTVKSNNWKGRYEAPGYLIINDKISPNYEKIVERLRFIYDIKHPNLTDALLQKYAYHNISYQKRSYLDRLLVNDVSQLYFYQGLIKQKGSLDAVNKILRSQYIRTLTDVEVYEEWMFNIGKYASYENYPKLNFYIDSENIKEDPHYVEFKEVELSSYATIVADDLVSATTTRYYYNTSSNTLWTYATASSEWHLINFEDFINEIKVSSRNYEINYITFDNRILYYDKNIQNDIYRYHENMFNIEDFPFNKLLTTKYERKIPTAGYVHISEVNDFVDDLNEFENKIITSADYAKDQKVIWFANATDLKNVSLKTWNVLEFREFSNKPAILSARINTSGLYEMVIKNGLVINSAVSTNDLIVVKSENSETFDGIYWVKSIENGTDIVTSAKNGFITSIDVSAYENEYTLNFFVMKTLRFANLDEMKEKICSNSYDNPFLSSMNLPKIVFVDDARDEKEIIHGIDAYYAVINISALTCPSVIYSYKRKEEKHIDNNKVDYLILRKNNEIKGFFECYDPIRGILPVVAMKNIDFMTIKDPAVYNTEHESVLVSDKNEWGDKQIGKIWWDLSKVRYYEYDMYSDDYRKTHWGKIASGEIKIYEWIESDVPPSEYNGEGIPYLEENTPYSKIIYVNPSTNKTTEKYYFWVEGKTTHSRGKIPTTTLESIIRNPVLNGIKWFALTSKNKILLGGSKKFVSKNNLIELKFSLHDYDNEHSDWILGREGDPSWIPPNHLWKKLVDSLVGFDEYFNEVPASNLNENEKYGIAIRPRQTIFKDKTNARKNLIHYLNDWFEKIRFNELYGGINLFDKEEEYPSADYEVNSLLERDSLVTLPAVNIGTKVLVKATSEINDFWTLWELIDKTNNEWQLIDIQKYRVLDFISYADYYDEEVDKNSPPLKVVDDITERNRFLSDGLIYDGDIILIKDNGLGQWEWQKYDGTTFITVAKQNATISFSDKFYKNSYVFAVNNLDEIFNKSLEEIKKLIDSRDGTRELRIILEIIKDFNNELVNTLFFNMVKYAQSENGNNNDWAVKTSYVVLGSIVEETLKDKILRPNLFESFLEYFEEIKPYHVKIRQHSRKLETGRDNLNVKIYDFEYGTSAYAYELTRKNDIEMVFDRVSCTYENVPEKLIFRSEKGVYEYKIPENYPIETIPPENYNPANNPDLWNKSNIRYVRTIVSTESTFLNETDYDIEISANNMIIKFNKTLEDGYIELARRIHAAERIFLYYEPETSSILNTEYKETPLPKNIENLVGCEFKETVVEGGALERDIRNFAALQEGGIIFYMFDPLPSGEFFEKHINPPLTPDGMDFDTFKQTYGTDWWNKYIDLYSNSDEFLIQFAELYGFDAGPYDGFVDLPIGTSASNSVDNLYDIIITGTSASSADPSWPDINAVFDTILEGNKFIQPYIQNNHPEELQPLRMFDTLIMRTSRYDTNTANITVSQRYKRKLTNGTVITLEEIPMNREGLLVFVNGKLLEENTHYTYEHSTLNITFINVSSYATSAYDVIDVRYFRPGGNSNWLYESHQYVSQATSGINEYSVFFNHIENTSGLQIYATLDAVDVSAIMLSGNKAEVSINSANTSSLISFYVFDGNHITIPRKLKIDYSAIPFTINLPTNLFTTLPYIENVLVFNNGIPLQAPHLIYKKTSNSSFSIRIDAANGVDNLRIYKNNILLSAAQYTYLAKTSSIDIDINAPLSSDSLLKILVYISGKYDYDITDNSAVLTLYTSTTADGYLTIVGFENNDSLNLKYERNDYELPHNLDTIETENNNPDSIFVIENNQMKTFETDYTIIFDKAGWDIAPWDSLVWDYSVEKAFIQYEDSKKDTSVFSITKREKLPYKEFITLRSTRDNLQNNYDIENHQIFRLEENIETDTSAFIIDFNDKTHPIKRDAFRKENRSYSQVDNLITINHELASYDKITYVSYLSGVFEYMKRGIAHTSDMIKEEKQTLIFTATGSSSEFSISNVSSFTHLDVEVYKLIYDENFITSASSFFPYDKIATSSIRYLYAPSLSAVPSSSIENYFTVSANKIKFFINPNPAVGNLITSAAPISANLPNIVITVRKSDWTNNNNVHISGNIGFIL